MLSMIKSFKARVASLDKMEDAFRMACGEAKEHSALEPGIMEDLHKRVRLISALQSSASGILEKLSGLIIQELGRVEMHVELKIIDSACRQLVSQMADIHLAVEVMGEHVTNLKAAAEVELDDEDEEHVEHELEERRVRQDAEDPEPQDDLVSGDADLEGGSEAQSELRK